MKTHRALQAIFRHVFSTQVPALTRAAVITAALSFGLANLRAEQAAAPVITPVPTAQEEIDGFSPQPPGSGNAPVTVTMTSATEGATIKYLKTTNNTGDFLVLTYDPDNKPQLVNHGTYYIRARAEKEGMEPSEIVSQMYIIHAPEIELFGFIGFGQVAINTTPDPKVFSVKNIGDMTLNIGSIVMETEDPDAWSYEFVGNKEMVRNATALVRVTFSPTEVKSYSVAFTIESDATSGANKRTGSGTGYDPTKVATPSISLIGEEIHYAPQEIWLQCGTAGATLYYTLDGSDPTEASNPYDPVNKLTLTDAGEYTIKVRGFKEGLTASNPATETFTVVERELTATDDFFFDPPVKIGEYQDRALVLTNVGSRPIEISLIEIDHEGFSVPGWTGPVTIPVGEIRNFTVRFAPQEMISYFGTLTISTNATGGNLTRGLNGNALPSDYGVDPATKTIGSDGGVYSVYVSLGGEWTASESLDWVSIVATPMLNDVTVTVAENTTGSAREGTITIAGKIHTVTQLAAAMEQVVAPVFSPDPETGPFSGTVNATLSSATVGAIVYYHWNPEVPKESWYQYGTGLVISISQTGTYYAYASKEGFLDSETVSATFTIETGTGSVAPPTMNPEDAETTFIGPVEVTFASTTDGASFRHTRFESASAEEWTVGGSTMLYYPGPLWVQAFKEALEDSAVVSSVYRIRASYSGSVSLGEFGVATWKLFLEADGSGLLIVEPLEGAPLVFDILIGADGSISATQKELSKGEGEEMKAAASAGFLPSALNPGEIEADIGPDGTITGELGGLGIIAGTVDPVTDEGRSICGFYQIDQLYAGSGQCYVIVGTDGKVTMVILMPDGVDTCEGSVDAGGHLVMTTAMGGEADLTIGSDHSLALTLMPQGASEPVEFAGLGAGATASNRLVNLSTRGWVGTQSQRLIAGFVIKGTGKKPVLIRAMGPAMSGYLSGTIEDPQIEVIPLGSTVALETNDNWGEVANLQALIDAMTVTGAFAAESGSKDAMILTELDPGNYTAKISGVGGSTGVSIVEVYTVEDLDTPEARQVNISTRAFVGTGGSIMILGMKADGNTPRQFLIRAVGPSLSLAPFNLTGVLEDPLVRVVRSSDSVVVATNDDWDEPGTGDAIHALSEQLGAFALPRGSKDAVVLVSLPTTTGFTVKVSGKDGATGVAIAEVYEVP